MPTMKINRAVRVKLISTGMEILGFFLKRNVSKYQSTVINVMDAGKDVGIVAMDAFEAFKDKKLSAEEELDLAKKLSESKESLDTALASLIKDLEDHATEKEVGTND